MAIFRCPTCQLPLTEIEKSLGKCSHCDQPFPLEALAARVPAAPPSKPELHGSEFRTALITWMLLCLGFVTLGILIAQQSPTAAPATEALSAEDVERIEKKLQRLEDLLKAKSLAKQGESPALLARLDKLDATVLELASKPQPPSAEAKAQGDQLARVEAKLEALALRAFSPPAPPGPLDIKVIAKDWNGAEPDNIQAVCLSAANEIWQHVPERRLEPITVTNSPKGPMVLFGRGPDGERRVLLQVKGKFWAQCGYQFAHEFCHILCNYREVKSPNHWFEESLCETASMFALRGMAKTWKIKPPYDNWRSFSDALTDYSDDLVRKTPPLDKLTLAAWYAKNEPELRANGTDRPRNRVVALALLKILERDPHHWQALGYLNQWDSKEANQSFALYLSDWHQRVPPLHKPFIKEVAQLFEIAVK